MKRIFLEESSFKQHLDAQNSNYVEYISHLFLLLYKYNINVSISKRAYILAAAMHRMDRELCKLLMSDYRKYDPRVIHKTCKILDSRRLRRMLEKKQAAPTQALEYLDKLNDGVYVSLTNSKCMMIRKLWIRNIEPEDLVLTKATLKMWRKIIDYTHPKPSDFQLSTFVENVFRNDGNNSSIVNPRDTEWVSNSQRDLDNESYDSEISILVDILTMDLSDDKINLCNQYLDGKIWDNYEPEYLMVTI